ncbi:class I SAM-dependent methyltransferase [Pseudomonas fragi]|uniref:class I SAM-dependent methyltransferase n=1 Tax=Pseudomonas fragi TaxID=296 RepID=UPI0012F8FE5A|nr:class I SAM-dependent methyltransferase [Pseudomonas fragi]
MPIDMDRYYTPENVAIHALERGSFPSIPKVCADSTCGSGRLLDAANTVFGSVHSIGIDSDEDAITQLRLRRPGWQLSVGDLLQHNPTDVFPKRQSVDLLVLNPPFSHGKRKFVDIQYAGKDMTGSIAMAHVMRSFELFQPTLGAIIIAPESLLYSETDHIARQTLEEDYLFEKIADLERCTFRGARVRASVVQISPGARDLTHQEVKSNNVVLPTTLVRGSLSVHLNVIDPAGVPFIHSTDLKHIVVTGKLDELSKTSNVVKGRTKGWVILIPRVGLPDILYVKALKLMESVQLSDCVIALEFPTKSIALRAERRIHSRWQEFRSLYRGTGARYITISRLSLWLPVIAISPIQ